MRSEMKKLILILTLILLTWNFSEAKNPYYPGRVTFHTFYYSLAPYGEWIEIDYGVYAWRPISISVGWSPYLIGRWVWTPYGWYWDSFEPFGWAVYHYGRWYYDDYYGWIWIPDYDWAPAWVEWRYNDFYVGWAPLPPYASFSVSIGIRFSINWYSPYHNWHFVPVNYFCGYEVHNYVVGPKYKYRIYRDTRYSVNYKYDGGRIINYGVDRKFVERRGGKIFEAKVEETSRLRDFTERKIEERNRVLIFRPDEREIDRNVDVRVRKLDRQISLDVNKIQTPRERIEIREQNRDNEKFNRERREEIEIKQQERDYKRDDNRKLERRNDDRKFEIERIPQSDVRIDKERKQPNQEIHKNSRDFDFRNEFNQRNDEQTKIQRRYDNTNERIERNRESSRFEMERQQKSMSPQRDEFRQRETDKVDSRMNERKRER